MTTGLWITLGIFLFFFFLFSVPFHITVGLKDSVSVMIRILFLKIPIFPRPKTTKKKPKDKKKSDQKKKPKKEKKKKDKKEKKKDDDKKQKPKKKIDIVFWVRLLLDVVTALFRKLGQNFKIRVHAYEICVASEDAAQTAVMYGTIQALSETLFLRLEKAINFKVVKNAPFGVYVDFLEVKPKANVKIDFSISLGGIFGILFGVIFAFIKSFITSSLKKNG